MTTSGTEMTVANGWVHATTSACMLVVAQLLQIVIAASKTQPKMTVEHAHAMKDSEVKAVRSGSELATQSVMAAMDLMLPTVTSVLIMQPRMNTDVVTVIGSGRVLAAISLYTRANVTPSVMDALVQQQVTVRHVTNMHS